MSTSMADSKEKELQDYCIKWRHDETDEVKCIEVEKDYSRRNITDEMQSTGQAVVYLEIVSNIPDELLEVDLKQVKRLKLSSLESFDNLKGLMEKVSPEFLELHDGDFFDELPEFPLSVVKLKLVRCRIKVEKTVPKLSSLKKLSLKNLEFMTADSIDKLLKDTQSVRKLKVTDCENAPLPKSLGNLKRLEVLNYSGTHLSAADEDTFSVFHELVELKELNLIECKLPLIPKSITKFPRLKKLFLTRNKLLGKTVPEALGQLTSLEELSLSTCYLSELPRSLNKLTGLKFLDLSANHLSAAGTLEFINSLPSLSYLSLAQCGLETLPKMDSLTELRHLELAYNNFSTDSKESPDLAILNGIPMCVSELDISGNNFSGGLPGIVGNLTSLTHLKASGCNLGVFPESILTLTSLDKLDLSRNKFETLPERFDLLEKLKVLQLEHNSKLKSLMGISKLRNLKNIEVSNCHALESPPPEVCKLGTALIQKFYLDAENELCKVLPTIAVVGESDRSKTHLVQSLVQEKSKDGTSTKVFEVGTMIEDMTRIRIIDFGGHEAYRITYCLALREDSIPVVVVNMETYRQKVLESSSIQAARRLCFDYLAQLYLIEQALPKPILVLTDKFASEDDFERVKRELLEALEQIRSEIAQDLCKHSKAIKHFDNNPEKFLEDKNVFAIGKDPADVAKVRSALFSKCKTLSKTQIPAQWKRASDKIGARPVVRVDEAVKCMMSGNYQDEISKKILSYRHSSGKLLWYQNVPGLSDYVFPKLETVGELLMVFFDHESDGKWQKRKEEFEESSYLKTKQEFETSIELFQKTGVMRKALLFYLITKESQFKTPDEAEVALTLLQSFQLVFGPIQKGESYVFPHFTNIYSETDGKDNDDLPFTIRNEISFHVLPMPLYAYHQMTVKLVQLVKAEWQCLIDPVVFMNGARVNTKYSRIQLIHDWEAKVVKIELSSKLEYVKQSWDQMVEISKSLIGDVSKTWKTVAFTCKVVCPHCLITKSLPPQQEENPSWTTVDGKVQYVRGMKATTCLNDVGIPAALRQPCELMSRRELKELEKYVKKVPRPEVQLVSDTDISEESDADEEKHFLLTRESKRLQVTPTRLAGIKRKFDNSDEVYPMSIESDDKKRGLALLINNVHFESDVLLRKGSEKDIERLSQLFNDMNFDVSTKKDLTHAELLSVLKEETHNPKHKDYQAFALVILSHGVKPDVVYGVDGNEMEVKDVISHLSSGEFKGMSGKPKLVIVQGCGTDGMKTLTDASETQAPQRDDIILAIATLSYNHLVRYPEYGSPFISCLVSTFARHACHRDVVALLQLVKKRVSQLRSKLENRAFVVSKSLEIPSKPCKKKFYLFPGYYGKKRAS